MAWQMKRITRRDCDLFVIYVYGPVLVGEYHFTINAEDGALKTELINSISDGVKVPMKTMKIAQEMASLAASELLKIAMGKWVDKPTYYQQIRELIEMVNKK